MNPIQPIDEAADARDQREILRNAYLKEWARLHPSRPLPKPTGKPDPKWSSLVFACAVLRGEVRP